MNPISALIVTYNSADHIAACVDAAARYCAEVLVVDNASQDGTLANIPAGTRVIANRENLGFAGGVNQGMSQASYDSVLLLNPDAVLLDDPAPLLQANAAVTAGLLVDENGSAQSGFTLRRFPTPWTLVFETLGLNRLWPSNPVNHRYRCLDLDLNQPQDAEQPAGAFLLIQRPAWQRISGFDTSFHPVWFEDVDFLKRLHDSGERIRFVPTVRACHAGGHSVGRLNAHQRTKYWYASLFKYAGKHFSPADKRIVALGVAVGASLRWVASLFGGASAQAGRRGYGQAVRLAMKSFWVKQRGDIGRASDEE